MAIMFGYTYILNFVHIQTRPLPLISIAMYIYGVAYNVHVWAKYLSLAILWPFWQRCNELHLMIDGVHKFGQKFHHADSYNVLHASLSLSPSLSCFLTLALSLFPIFQV